MALANAAFFSCIAARDAGHHRLLLGCNQATLADHFRGTNSLLSRLILPPDFLVSKACNA